MILPLPRTGPSRRCRLQLTTQIRLSSCSRPASPIAPIDSGSSISPSPRNAHTLRPSVSAIPRAVQVLHEPRLVDRGDRADPQRHGRELPEVGHQPRVRVRGQAAAADLLAEAVELLVGQPPLEERARVVAGRRVALEVDEVAAVLVGRRVPEVVEADLVERRQRLVAGDVAAELGGQLVGAHDHRDRVPADDRAQPALELRIAGERRLAVGRDRVDVGGVEARDRAGAGVLGALDDARQELARAVGAVVRDDGVERLEPLGRLDRVEIRFGAVGARRLKSATSSQSSGGARLMARELDYTRRSRNGAHEDAVSRRLQA